MSSISSRPRRASGSEEFSISSPFSAIRRITKTAPARGAQRRARPRFVAEVISALSWSANLLDDTVLHEHVRRCAYGAPACLKQRVTLPKTIATSLISVNTETIEDRLGAGTGFVGRWPRSRRGGSGSWATVGGLVSSHRTGGRRSRGFSWL